MAITVTSAAAVASSTSSTATTDSFTPAVGEDLVVLATGGASSSVAVTLAISDSQGGSWTQVIQANLTAPGGDGGGGVTGIWRRTVASATSMTVTVTASGGTPNASGLQVYRLATSGGRTIQYGTGARGTSTGNPTSITPSALTSTIASSLLFAATSEWTGGATMSSSDLTATSFSNANMEGIWGYKTLGAAGAQTLNAQASGSAGLWYWAAVEVWDQMPTTGPLSASVSMTGAAVTGLTGASSIGTSMTGAAALGITLGGARTASVAMTGNATVVSRVFTGLMEVEFSAGVWTDVTPWMRLPVVIRQGRSTPYDDIAGGSMEFDLDNPDGRFTPGNTAGAYSPDVRRGVAVRWTVTKSGTSYRRFTGWIQRWRPSWPSGQWEQGIVRVQAVDALGLLGQRKMRSNFTETVLWRARTDVVAADAWEPVGSATGMQVELTNYSEDASPGASNYVYSGLFPNLSFSSDDQMSIGQAFTSNPSAEGNSNRTICGFQANPLQIIIHFKAPTELSNASYYTVASFETSGGTFICNLIYSLNGSENGLFLMNANNTTNLGLVNNLPRGQWVKIRLVQNAGTATHMDVYAEDGAGGSGIASNVNIDIRTIGLAEMPGGVSLCAAGSWGGIAALGTRTPIGYDSSWAGAAAGTGAARVSALANMVSRLPVTLATLSMSGINVLTGQITGRTAADVLREIARSGSGLVWARPRDSAVYAYRSSTYVRPASPVATIDLDADCAGPPVVDDATDQQPTRVEATWPGGSAVAVDSTAEAAGESRTHSVTTICTSQAAAASVAADLLAQRTLGPRVSRVTVDLTTGVTDHTAALFSTSATLEGLYPSVRLRLSGPGATGIFGSSTTDVHAEGWTERYAATGVTIEMDTSPAA